MFNIQPDELDLLLRTMPYWTAPPQLRERTLVAIQEYQLKCQKRLYIIFAIIIVSIITILYSITKTNLVSSPTEVVTFLMTSYQQLQVIFKNYLIYLIIILAWFLTLCWTTAGILWLWVYIGRTKSTL